MAPPTPPPAPRFPVGTAFTGALVDDVVVGAVGPVGRVNKLAALALNVCLTPGVVGVLGSGEPLPCLGLAGGDAVGAKVWVGPDVTVGAGEMVADDVMVGGAVGEDVVELDGFLGLPLFFFAATLFFLSVVAVPLPLGGTLLGGGAAAATPTAAAPLLMPFLLAAVVVVGEDVVTDAIGVAGTALPVTAAGASVAGAALLVVLSEEPTDDGARVLIGAGVRNDGDDVVVTGMGAEEGEPTAGTVVGDKEMVAGAVGADVTSDVGTAFNVVAGGLDVMAMITGDVVVWAVVGDNVFDGADVSITAGEGATVVIVLGDVDVGEVVVVVSRDVKLTIIEGDDVETTLEGDDVMGVLLGAIVMLCTGVKVVDLEGDGDILVGDAVIVLVGAAVTGAVV